MIAVIAEKSSIGRDIARVLGVTNRGEGYLYNNEYIVTWTYGHLVSLAPPKSYGYTRLSAGDLPFVPDPYKLIVRKRKTTRGTTTDSTAYKQLRVIKTVFEKCDSIIVATDAGGEGELIFKYIYEYLKCEKPFCRLWINSLTDKSIKHGFANLRDGAEYNNLCTAANCRAKADWLVEINASRAFSIAMGGMNNHLARLHTPALAMICSRYLEYRDFRPSDYWAINIALGKDEKLCTFSAKETFMDRYIAEYQYADLKRSSQAQITKVIRKTIKEPAPLLYNLTSLQKDANTRFGITAERTLELAQRLYEKKLISYPRTESRYIPQELLPEILFFLDKIRSMDAFTGCRRATKITSHSVNDRNITDHHAIIITEIDALELKDDEQQIYNMIAGRVLESFSAECKKESIQIEVLCGGRLFHKRTDRITSPGWRGINNYHKEETDDDPDAMEQMPSFVVNETLLVQGYALSARKTTPRPLYTEATLLDAMETVGRDSTNESQREALREIGIGTPTTRTSIISTLLGRKYIEYSAKSLIPTMKGLSIYLAVKKMRIADVELTQNWEESLAMIERGEADTATFMSAMEIHARQVVSEILALKKQGEAMVNFSCPKCKTGGVIKHSKIVRCTNPNCYFVIFRRYLNKELTDHHLEQLFSVGETDVIEGFESRKGRVFDAYVYFDKDFDVLYKLAENKP